MKCTLNGKEIFELAESQIKLFQHIIPAEEIEDHLKHLVVYVVGQKLREAAGKLFEEWKPKMVKEGITSVPLLDMDLAQLIFDRPDYQPIAKSVTGIETTE